MRPDDLPVPLAERITPKSERDVRADGEFVLYWMRTGARGHENPALDVALSIGNAAGKPVLVYQGLSERYPFASDRLHAFALEGLRDASIELADRSIAHACHVERDGHRGPHLKMLAQRAVVVITEDLPVPPLAGWTAALAASAPCAVWAVDTACIVPMRLVTNEPERAFAFRDETAALRTERLLRSWRDVAPAVPTPDVADLDLPFEPVDLASVDLEALLAECEIDHSVAPVADTEGGARAGYARFESFLRRVRHYAGTRNDPAKQGVSRMSAYLHFGHVSPFRIARQVAAVGGKGPDKFLEELLVWRELAHAWCWHRDGRVEGADALPQWASATLRAHEQDARPALFSQERLARARTGDELWDAAERSLLRHGELHNNVRMTWGKAIPTWTSDLESAMACLTDLNHRYALDGRDPNSYAGLWWCLGLFDRPFLPERPVLGTVRPRPTAEHARRMDVARYAAHVDRPVLPVVPRVAIVGGGMAGLACARVLHDHGVRVKVFDKGRKAGGRMSSRLVGEQRFDTGAQFFTARGPGFARRVESWVAEGVVARWNARIVALKHGALLPDPRPGERFVGTPHMAAVIEHLSEDLDVTFGVRVDATERRDGRWWIGFEDGEQQGPFELLVLALPAPQAAALLGAAAELQRRVERVVIAPCAAVMVAFDAPVVASFEAAFVSDSPLAWVARDASKPGRVNAEAWVLHATPAWSRANLEREPESWIEPLCDAFAAASGARIPVPSRAHAHRWRFALPEVPLGVASAFDVENGVGVCGDWCAGARVEGAYESGVDLAGRLLRHAVFAGRRELRSAARRTDS